MLHTPMHTHIHTKERINDVACTVSLACTSVMVLYLMSERILVRFKNINSY